MESFIIRKLIETTETYGSKVAIVDYPAAAYGGTANCRQPRTTTYDQLWRNARKVAACILDSGIAPQSFVTIELPQSMEFLAAQLGVWLAHCVAVPVGVNFPEERKTYIREHCDSALHIDYNKVQDMFCSEKLADVSIPDESEDALLIYTSGSTGNPKGILHDHRSLMNPIEVSLQLVIPTPEDRYASYVPSYFIVELSYMVIIFGTELHIIPMEVAKDTNALADYHRDHAITMAFVSATVIPVYTCKSNTLKIVYTGSDRVVCREKPPFRLINAYGLTETAGGIIFAEITDVTDNAPIGLPVKGIEFALLDDDLQPVAQGEEGEICLKGHFAKCYFKDEEMTRELYRGGWLHTRDLGRLTPDGLIQFVNRKDWMVKVNGHRVEPGEVEAAMRKAHGVKKAVVKGFPGSQGSQYLVGYYTLEEERGEWSVESGKRMEETIRALLERLLPHYMVPTFFVQLDAFPLNANGKVDRKSLMPPASESLQEDYVAPTNETEALLCQAFAKVLQLPRVGINDDFIQLGGDSIKMMSVQQFCAASDNDVLRTISARQIYQGRTPKGIATLLEKTIKYEKALLDDYPLSGIQNSYLQLCLQHVGQPVFNVSNLLALHGETDMQRLASAIEKVVSSHAGLHARLFENAEGEVRQKVVREPFSLRVEHLSEKAFEAEKLQLVQPFRLLIPHETGDRLFRFRLFETEGGKYLFYDIHHVIYDGASQTILFRDIEQAYHGMTTETEDWTLFEMAAEEQHIRQTEALQLARSWYRSTFANAIPLWRPDTAPDASPKLTSLMTTLDVPVEKSEAACASAGVTMNALTTAAFAFMLGQYAHTKDVVFASAYNAREDSRVRNTVGLFARPLFVRICWTADTRTKDFLQGMRRTLLECMDNSIYSYAEMQADIPMSPGYLFIYQGDLAGEPVIGGHPTTALTIAEKQAASAIEAHLFLDRANSCLKMKMLYKQAFYTEDDIKRMVAYYQSVLKGLMTTEHLYDITRWNHNQQ